MTEGRGRARLGYARTVCSFWHRTIAIVEFLRSGDVFDTYHALIRFLSCFWFSLSVRRKPRPNARTRRHRAKRNTPKATGIAITAAIAPAVTRANAASSSGSVSIFQSCRSVVILIRNGSYLSLMAS